MKDLRASCQDETSSKDPTHRVPQREPSLADEASAHDNRLNKVDYIQDILLLLFLNAVLAKEDDLFERITLKINLFLYIQKEQDLVLTFYRFLSLEKLGHRIALFLTLWSLQSKGGGRGRGKHAVYGWGFREVVREHCV